MRTLTRTALAAALFPVLAACSSLLPPSPPPPVAHDFGPSASGAPAYTIKHISLNRIAMPDWLDDSAIHYRELNQDPTAVNAYADNVWVASPATLLRQCLLQAGLQPGARSDAKEGLSLSINDFEQVISARDQAHIEVGINARLRNLKDGQIIASRHFEDHQPVAANVQGAVKGLASAGQQQCRAILDWLKQQ